MKTAKVHPMEHAMHIAREYEAQQEIRNFLWAMSSYPDRFAQNPALSFQQHLNSVATQTSMAASAHN
jgi:hypothetical protein